MGVVRAPTGVARVMWWDGAFDGDEVLMGKAVRPGDVFQILTSKGICYGLVTHRHPKYRFVVALFRRFFDQPPKDFASVVAEEPRLVTTFLIGHAVSQGLFRIVASVPVPLHLHRFPIFRASNDPQAAEPVWFFWDGDREWRIGRPLTEAERRYPRGPSFPSAPLLIEWIETDHRAERDFG